MLGGRTVDGRGMAVGRNGRKRERKHTLPTLAITAASRREVESGDFQFGILRGVGW